MHILMLDILLYICCAALVAAPQPNGAQRSMMCTVKLIKTRAVKSLVRNHHFTIGIPAPTRMFLDATAVQIDFISRNNK